MHEQTPQTVIASAHVRTHTNTHTHQTKRVGMLCETLIKQNVIIC